MPDEDRRLVLVSVRLTERENQVVEELCCIYRCSRSQLVRMMYTLSLPAIVPALNVHGFEVLDRIGFELSKLENSEPRADGPLVERLAEVKAALDQVRDMLMGAAA